MFYILRPSIGYENDRWGAFWFKISLTLLPNHYTNDIL